MLKDPVHSFQTARELYSIFIIEVAETSGLQKIVDHALEAESREDLYREAWTTGVTWLLIHAQRVQEMLNKLEKDPTNN